MLLNEVKEPFDDKDYLYELKLDGIRCIAYLGKDVVLQNKRFKDVSAIYPELSDMSRCVKKNTVLDGELVVLTDGKPDFYALQKRSLMTDKFRIKLAAKKNPVQFAAYDILYYDGEDLTDKPLIERKSLLQAKVSEGNGLSISRYIEEQGITPDAMKLQTEGNLSRLDSIPAIAALREAMRTAGDAYTEVLRTDPEYEAVHREYVAIKRLGDKERENLNK